ncbi:hypothetical protein IMZ68_04330 [Candidatus Bathyarchaeota archaeon]|nr:hypothetical protein [Candidatus Bathyarchaeota archaeon]
MDKKPLTLFCMLMLLTPLLSLPFVEFASANFGHYFAPKMTVISPTTDTVYDTLSILLSVKVEMQNWNWTDWEKLAVMNYSLDGQQDVAVPVTNEIKSNGNGLATVNGLATTTISGIANGAHSLYIHGETTFSQYSSSGTPLSLTIYFIVNAATPTIQVLSPQQKTYNSIDVPLVFKSNKPLTWAGYSLDQKMVVTSLTSTTITNLFNGVHYLRVYGNDSNGNICASQEIVFTINGKKPPIVTIDSQAIMEARKHLPSDFGNRTWTYLPLKFHVNEPTTWTGYSIDGGAIQTIEGNMTLANLPFGSHTIIVYAKDICGNMGTSAPCTINLLRGEAGSAYALPTASQTSPQELTSESNTSNNLFPMLMVVASVALVAIVASLLLYRRHQKTNANRVKDFLMNSQN